MDYDGFGCDFDLENGQSAGFQIGKNQICIWTYMKDNEESMLHIHLPKPMFIILSRFLAYETMMNEAEFIERMAKNSGNN